MAAAAVAQCHNQLIIGHGGDFDDAEKKDALMDIDSLNVSVSAGILFHLLCG